MDMNNSEVRTYPEAVELCVNWWVEKSFNTQLNQNIGDDSINGGLVFLALNTSSLEAQSEITSSKIDLFKKSLTDYLLTNGPRLLDVDYSPDLPLAEACKSAGIRTGCLPKKTFTEFNKKNQLITRYQNGAFEIF